jgi:hypothetical protein
MSYNKFGEKKFLSYSETIEIKPFYHTNFKDGLENVFLKDKPNKDNTIVGRLFSDKTETQKSTAKALLDEIILRENLDYHILSKINENISWQKIQLEHLNTLKIDYVFEWFQEINKMKMHLEDNILELEQEKRKEYLECWRDLMYLKKNLLVALKDFWDLLKKKEILSSDLTELSQNENREGN